MAEDCLFCRIVDGDVPSRTVYEDEDVLAFLDDDPLARGHTLVVPKAHHRFVQDAAPDLAAALFDAAYELVPVIEEAVDADGFNVGMNVGDAAGQEIPHAHVHVLPRFEDDGGRPFSAVAAGRPGLADEEIDAVAEAIRDAR